MTSEAPSLLLVSAGLKNQSAGHREDKVNLKAWRSPTPTQGHHLYDGPVGRTQRAVLGLPPGLLPFPEGMGVLVKQSPCSYF